MQSQIVRNLSLTIPPFPNGLANSLIPLFSIPDYLSRKQIPKPRTPQIPLPPWDLLNFLIPPHMQTA